MLSIWTVTGALQAGCLLNHCLYWITSTYTRVSDILLDTTDVVLDYYGGQQHCLTGVCKSLAILS